MSYIKSLTNNIKFGLPKLVLQKLPGFNSIQKNISESRNLENSPFKSDFGDAYSSVADVFKKAGSNTVKSLKSGEILSDSDNDMMEAMGFDLSEFDDMGSDFDFDDESSTTTSEKSSGTKNTKNVKINNIKNNPIRVTNNNVSYTDSTPIINGLESTARTVDRSSRGIIKSVNSNNMATFSLIQMQTSLHQSFYEESGRHFSIVEGVMSSIEQILENKLDKLLELTEAHAEKYGIKSKSSTSSDSIYLSDIISNDGEFNVTKYFEVLGQRAKSATGASSTFGMIASSFTRPLNLAAETLVDKFLSSSKFNALKDLGKSIESLPTLFFKKLSDLEKSDSFLAPIAKFFNVGNENPNASLSRFERGPIPFDGITKKAIVEVIPALLSKILSAVSKDKDELVYDYSTGTFTTNTKILKAKKDKELSDISMNNDTLFSKLDSSEFAKGLGHVEKELLKRQMAERLQSLGLSNTWLDDNFKSGGGQVDDLLEKLLKGSSVGDLSKINKELSGIHGISGAGANLSEAERMVLASRGLDNTGVKTTSSSTGLNPLLGSSKGKDFTKGSYTGSEGQDSLHVDNVNRFGEDLFEKREFTLKTISEIPAKALSRISNAINDTLGSVLFGRKRKIFRSDGSIDESNTEESTKKGGILTSFSNAFDSIKGAISLAIFGKKSFNEDGSPTDPNSFLKDKTDLFTNIKNGLLVTFDSLKNRFLGIVDSISDFTNEKILKPMSETFGKVNTWFKDELFTPIANYFKDRFVKGDKDNMSLMDKVLSPLTTATEYIRGKVSDGFDFVKNKTIETFNKLSTFILGEKTDEGTRKDGLFSNAINRFNEQLLNPAKQFLFGEAKLDADGNIVEKEGLFRNLGSKIVSKVFEPVSNYFSKLGQKVNENLFMPIKDALFGKVLERDKNGNPISKKQGIVDKFQDSFRKNIIDPTKNYFFGKEKTDKDGNIIQKAGLFSRIGDSIYKALNGGQDVPEDGKTFFQRGLDYLNEKIFAPIKNYFMDEQNGIFVKLNKYIDEKVLSPIKTYLLGDVEGKESGVLTKIGNWFDEKLFKPVGEFFYGNDNGKLGAFQKLETWFTDKISTPFKNYMFGEDGKTGLWGNIKTSVDEFFFGNEEQGKKGFYGKFIEPSISFIKEEILSPLSDSIKDMWETGKTFIKESVLTPLKGTLQPYLTEMGIQLDNLKNGLKAGIMEAMGAFNSTLKDTLGVDVKEYLKENILNPIKDTLSSLKTFIGNMLGRLIKLPVNLIKDGADNLKHRHLMMGKGDYLSDEERERILGKFNTDGSKIKSSLFSKSKDKAESVNDVTPEANAKKGIFGSIKSIFGNAAKEIKEASIESSKKVVDSVKDANDALANQYQTVSEKVAEKINKAAETVSDAVKSTSPIKKSNKQSKGSDFETDLMSFSDSKATSSVKEKVSPTERIVKATETSATSSKEILSFMKNNLQGVGYDVAKIAKHLGASDLAAGSGGNEKKKGFFGKIMDFVKSPFKVLGDTIKGFVSGVWNTFTGALKEAWSVVSTFGKSLLKIGTELVKLPLTIINTASKIVGSVVEVMAPVAKTILEQSSKILGGIIDGAFEIVKGAGSILFESAMQVGGFITKKLFPALGTLAGVVVDLSMSIVKATGAVIKFGLNLVSSAFSFLTGSKKNKKGDGTGTLHVKGGYLDGIRDTVRVYLEGGYLDGVRETQDVYVVGGKLDGGKDSPIKTAGKDSNSIVAEMKEKAEKLKSFDIQETIVENTGATATGIGKIRTGFGRLLTVIGTIGAGLAIFTKKVLAFFAWRKLVEAARGVGDFVRGRRGPKGIPTGGGNPKSSGGKGWWNKAKGAASGINLKGLGIVAVAGFAGGAISDKAANMEDGVAKTAVGTLGAAASWGGTGAMIGFVIPGLGTAVGAGVGAALGAIVHNFDSILSGVGAVIGGAASLLSGAVKAVIWPFKKLGQGVKWLTGTVFDGVAAAFNVITSPIRLIAKGATALYTGMKAAATKVSEGLFGEDEAEYNEDGTVKKFRSKGIFPSIKGAIFGLDAEYDNEGNVTRLPEHSMLGFGRMKDLLFGKEDVTNKDGTIAVEGTKGVLGFVKDSAIKLTTSLSKAAGNAKDTVFSVFNKIGSGIKNRILGFFGLKDNEETPIKDSNASLINPKNMTESQQLQVAESYLVNKGIDPTLLTDVSKSSTVNMQSKRLEALQAEEMKTKLEVAETKISSENYNFSSMIAYLAQIAQNTSDLKEKEFTVQLDESKDEKDGTNNKDKKAKGVVNIFNSNNNVFQGGGSMRSSTGLTGRSRSDMIASGR